LEEKETVLSQKKIGHPSEKIEKRATIARYLHELSEWVCGMLPMWGIDDEQPTDEKKHGYYYRDVY
jgi:hypothetical protein